MARFIPTDVLSSYSSVAALNANFDDIAALLERVVFRDGTASNSMLADLDLNHFKIQNVADGVAETDAVNVGQVTELVETYAGALPSVSERAGQYLAFDADGQMVASSGTGADAGLRTDLATNGAPLVGFDQTTVAAKLADMPSVKDKGAAGNNGAGDAAIIQEMLDTLPVGKTLNIPLGVVTGAYKITGDSFNMKRQMNLRFEQGATLRSDQVAGERFPALAVNITEVAGDAAPTTTGEARGIYIEGGSLATNSLTTPGGDDAGGYALEISGDAGGDYKATKEVRIRHMSLTGGLGGFAFKGGLASGQLQWSGIYESTTNGGLFASTDGTVAVDCSSHGNPYVFDMASAGAFNSGIFRGTISSSDHGAIDVVNGNKIKVHDVQVEYTAATTSALPHNSLIAVRGTDYPAVSFELLGTNLGSSSVLSNTLYLGNTRGAVVDGNYWGRSGDGDIYIDAGSTDTIIGYRNRCRGTRTRQAVGEYTDVSRLLVINSPGVIDKPVRGMWYPAISVMTYINPLIANIGLEVMLDINGRVRFNGGIQLTSGTFTTDQHLFTFPDWLTPFRNAYMLASGRTIPVPTIILGSDNGASSGLFAVTADAAVAAMHFDNVGWNAVVDADYSPEPL